MNFRHMKIGQRLGIGFFLILLVSGALVVGSVVSSSASRTALLGTMQRAAAQQELAHEMNLTLLKSAVAVRNMGLQTTVDGVQKAETEANQQRAAYLEAKGKLESIGLAAKEREVLARLVEIDRQTDAHFKEAVGLASQFAIDQAGVVIAQKMDPLLKQAMTELANFITLQKQHTDAANAAAAQIEADNKVTIGIITVVGVLMLAFSALMAWRLTLSITRPLQNALAAAAHVAQGDLVSEIDIDNVNSDEETGILLIGLQKMRNSLAEIVGEVRACAESISTGANEIAAGNADLSQRTEAQACNLEQTAASIEELHAAVKNNAETANEVNRMASAASAAAVKGGSVMGQVVVTMQEITVASRKIADIIQVIDGIAFQTNILALNAAVEAARAGEQGRGFAVVATEVRSLAGRSAKAAQEIKSLIGASVNKVESGTQLVNQAGDSMQDIVTQVKQVAGLIANISVSAQEQSCGIAQINQSIMQLDSVTQQNAALVEQAAAAANGLNRQATRMVEVVGVFKLSDGHLARHAHDALPREPSKPRAKSGAVLRYIHKPKQIPISHRLALQS